MDDLVINNALVDWEAVEPDGRFEADPARCGFNAARLTRLTTHFQTRYIDAGRLPGCQILVVRRGVVAYHSCFGFSDVESAKETAPDTIYRLHSLTKPITSVACMQLVEDGVIGLKDDVARFVPSWGRRSVWSGDRMDSYSGPIRVSHLLTHTSGLTYGGLLSRYGTAEPRPLDQEYRAAGVSRSPGETLESMAERLAHVPLLFRPGSRWMYSLATEVCARIVEVASGQRFDEYLRSRVLDPLGMSDCGFTVSAADSSRLATSYGRDDAKRLVPMDVDGVVTEGSGPTFLSGASGLYGTILDYAKFCAMLLAGGASGDGSTVVGNRTLRLMMANHLPSGHHLAECAIEPIHQLVGTGFGLGFAVTDSNTTFGPGSYFWDGAASTLFWVDPVEQMFVIFLTQFTPQGTFRLREQLKNLIYSSMVDS